MERCLFIFAGGDQLVELINVGVSRSVSFAIETKTLTFLVWAHMSLLLTAALYIHLKWMHTTAFCQHGEETGFLWCHCHLFLLIVERAYAQKYPSNGGFSWEMVWFCCDRDNGLFVPSSIWQSTNTMVIYKNHTDLGSAKDAKKPLILIEGAGLNKMFTFRSQFTPNNKLFSGN